MSRTRRERGASLVEVLAASLILVFLVASVGALYQTGQKQQLASSSYSQAQTDLRFALRRITRTLRHGSAVVTSSSYANFTNVAPNSRNSGGDHIIVNVPEPNSTTATMDVRITLVNGTVYAQRGDDATSGVALITGVNSISFRYFLTTFSGTGVATSTEVAAAPGTATEVQIVITAQRWKITTPVQTYVQLRNAALGI